MEDIRIDKDGLPRCWNCGSKGFTEKRTFRAKATAVGAGLLTVGVAGGAAALLTKKETEVPTLRQIQRHGKWKTVRRTSRSRIQKGMEGGAEGSPSGDCAAFPCWADTCYTSCRLGWLR